MLTISTLVLSFLRAFQPSASDHARSHCVSASRGQDGQSPRTLQELLDGADSQLHRLKPSAQGSRDFAASWSSASLRSSSRSVGS